MFSRSSISVQASKRNSLSNYGGYSGLQFSLSPHTMPVTKYFLLDTYSSRDAIMGFNKIFQQSRHGPINRRWARSIGPYGGFAAVGRCRIILEKFIIAPLILLC